MMDLGNMSRPFPRTTPERAHELRSLLLHLQRNWTSSAVERRAYNERTGSDTAGWIADMHARRYRLAMWVLEQGR